LSRTWVILRLGDIPAKERKSSKASHKRNTDFVVEIRRTLRKVSIEEVGQKKRSARRRN
jgi:hypothetical protein